MHPAWIERRKWPHTPHYGYGAAWLGQDAYGEWFGQPRHQPIYRGDRVLFESRLRGLVLVPFAQWWMAWFPEGHDEVALYVDIVTPPQRRGSTISMVDLDLDVLRRRGELELVDEDEFALHQHLYGYPTDLVHFARQAAEDVVRAAADGSGPFGVPPERWWRLLDLVGPTDCAPPPQRPIDSAGARG